MTRSERSADGQGNVLKGLAAGALGGMAGAMVMAAVRTKVGARLVERLPAPDEEARTPAEEANARAHAKGSQKPAVPKKAVTWMVETATGHGPTKVQLNVGGPVAHVMTGALIGAAYGAAAESAPAVTVGRGAPFGAAVWALNYEGLMPALGVTPKPTDLPVHVHANALLSHLAYGVATETVRGVVRARA